MATSAPPPTSDTDSTPSSDKVNEIHPIYSAILECVADKDSHLYALAGTPSIVDKIWKLVEEYIWKQTIIIPQQFEARVRRPDYKKCPVRYIFNLEKTEEYEHLEMFVKPYVNWCVFPEPNDININMMPFIMSNEFSETQLPDYLNDYAELIRLCNIEKEQMGKVCYLSIQESRVKGNTSQRRPGLHTECPGKVKLNFSSTSKGGGKCSSYSWDCHPWGEGTSTHHLVGRRLDRVGGIYMASTEYDSCMVWNCKIPKDPHGREIIGEFGDIEHLRNYLPQPMHVDANRIIWITDRTPHESLPLKDGTYRQWFRLVTSQVGLWFEDHSTKNPNGVVPDPAVTHIVRGSKFKHEDLWIVKDLPL